MRLHKRMHNADAEEEAEEAEEEEDAGDSLSSPPTAYRKARYDERRREQKRRCAANCQKELRTTLFQGCLDRDQAERLPTTLHILKSKCIDHIVFKGKLAPSRAEALMLIAEVRERDGKLPQLSSPHAGLGKRCLKYADHILAGCFLNKQCEHCIEWRPFIQGQWRCVKFVPHYMYNRAFRPGTTE
ncbi:hypothetical protein CYMTET_30066 [Cymbomonas tetramitiformis]|uniref:Uncharacterized protein n=1 Tax=Cymbomonas tetramitiformis TaxID=36881 RepID=A0AAE0KUI6_9CHLO|nr:hypothetical protein CYMTET_30066 [Cymbomonas tetramitiformis]